MLRSPRVVCACALLALPAGAIAQTRSQTVFSASRTGSVSIRAAVVLPDYTVKPLPLLSVTARRNGATDSVSGRTDLEGRLSMTLPAGRYTLSAKSAQPIAARVYSWAVPVTIEAGGTRAIELTNANAVTDSVAVVARVAEPVRAAPQAAPGTHMSDHAAGSAIAQIAPAQGAGSVEPAERAAGPVGRHVSPAAISAPAEGATASRANTSGFFVGLALNGSAIRADDLSSSIESGGGLSLQLGWGFTKNVALFLDGSAAQIASDAGNYDLAHFDIGARWHFVSPSRALVPFLEVAVTGRAAGQDNVLLYDDFGNAYQGDLSIAGSGFSLGGGLQYFVAPKWALGGSLEWTTGEFSRVRFDNVTVDGLQLDATSSRFNLGFTWYPMGGTSR